jgi:hypothetical protein
MAANSHKVSGTIQLTKSGNSTVLTLWNVAYNDKLQKDIRTPYKLWMNVPGDWTEGSFLEVEGELTVRPSTNIDGTPRTYLDSKGNTITSHDLNLNNITIIKIDIKTGADTSNVDMDDVRKYGTPLMQTILDDQPF